MKVVVFGASGRVGSRVVELLLAQKHDVFAVVHSKDIFQGTPNLYVKRLDVHDAEAVAEVLEGADAVLSCVSSWGSEAGDVLSSAMKAILPAMQRSGTKRIVSLTGTGALIDTDKPSIAQKASHVMMSKVAPKVLADGEEHIRLLQASAADWTVLRSPVMNNRGSAKYRLTAELPGNQLATINRQAVAVAMVELLHDGTWLRQAPCIERP